MSTGSGDHESVPSSSEHDSSDEETEEQLSEEEAAPALARSIQVVATQSRPRRGSGDSSDEGDDQEGEESSSSSSEAEGDEGEPAAADGPARGKSYRSIRARKPKKKVYARPNDERGNNATSNQSRDNTSEERQTTLGLGNGPPTSEADQTSTNTVQRGGIRVQPSQLNNTTLGGGDSSEGSDIDWEPVIATGSSTQELAQTQIEIEGGQARPRDTPFSRLINYAGSFRAKLSKRNRRALEELESDESDDNVTEVFGRMSFEEQPSVLKKDSVFRRRANKAIINAVKPSKQPIKQKPEETEEDSDGGLCNCNCFRKKGKEKEKKIPGVKKKKPPATKLSPQLQKASNEGINMMKKVFFPALPHLLRDGWVHLEFGITMLAFVLGLLSLDLNEGSKVFNIVYLALTILSVILAAIDWFIYFITMGSCAECAKIFVAKLKKESELEVLENDNDTKGRCRLPKKYKDKFNTYFELVRNIISEVILYPLLICDLFDFIVGGVFRSVDSSDRVDFFLFVVGNLYLILAVYFMRMFLIIGLLLSLKKLPKLPNDSGSQGTNVRLLTQFAVHILLQIFIHFVLIVSIALKIRHENPDFGNQDSIFASTFLWINVVLGGFIPIVGIISFFITDYYHMREFSISFWIDMMAMLQAPSVTDAVFPSEDGESPADAALEFVKQSELKKVKKQFERYKSPSWYAKFFFPLKLPLGILIGSLYVIGLFVFVGSLILTQDPISPSGSTVQVVLFEDIPITVAFFVCGVLITAFNVKIIVLVIIFFILSTIAIVIVSLAIAILLPFVVFIYLPIGCFVLQYTPKSLIYKPLEEDDEKTNTNLDTYPIV